MRTKLTLGKKVRIDGLVAAGRRGKIGTESHLEIARIAVRTARVDDRPGVWTAKLWLWLLGWLLVRRRATSAGWVRSWPWWWTVVAGGTMLTVVEFVVPFNDYYVLIAALLFKSMFQNFVVKIIRNNIQLYQIAFSDAAIIKSISLCCFVLSLLVFLVRLQKHRNNVFILPKNLNIQIFTIKYTFRFAITPIVKFRQC